MEMLHDLHIYISSTTKWVVLSKCLSSDDMIKISVLFSAYPTSAFYNQYCIQHLWLRYDYYVRIHLVRVFEVVCIVKSSFDCLKVK